MEPTWEVRVVHICFGKVRDVQRNSATLAEGFHLKVYLVKAALQFQPITPIQVEVEQHNLTLV